MAGRNYADVRVRVGGGIMGGVLAYVEGEGGNRRKYDEW